VARVAGDSKTALRLIAGGDADANGDPMADSVDGVVEQTFEHLATRDWTSFGALLAADIERIGPFGERVVGRDPYVELMAAGDPPASDDAQDRTTWDIHRVVYASDRRSAFARVTAHVPHGGRELRVDQALAYELDANGLISRIEVFWRDPRGRPRQGRESPTRD
jgi:hypothetical protein